MKINSSSSSRSISAHRNLDHNVELLYPRLNTNALMFSEKSNLRSKQVLKNKKNLND